MGRAAHTDTYKDFYCEYCKNGYHMVPAIGDDYERA